MSIVRTDLRETRERARELRFEGSVANPATDVQKAIERATALLAVSATQVAVVNSPYHALATDTAIYVNTSTGPTEIVLQPSAARGGVPLIIKDTGGSGGANNITITPAGGETVDNIPAPFGINSDYGGYRLYPTNYGYTVGP